MASVEILVQLEELALAGRKPCCRRIRWANLSKLGPGHERRRLQMADSDHSGARFTKVDVDNDWHGAPFYGSDRSGGNMDVEAARNG